MCQLIRLFFICVRTSYGTLHDFALFHLFSHCDATQIQLKLTVVLSPFAPVLLTFHYNFHLHDYYFIFHFLLFSFYHLEINPFSSLILSLFFLQFICLYPSDILSWIILLTAAVASSIFLLRNLAPIIISQAGQQSALLLGAIGYVTHFHFPL